MNETPPSGFDELIRVFLSESFRLNPLAATAAGIHDYDSAWPDLSDAGRLAAVSAIDGWAGCFPQTPGFGYRSHLESMISHGSLPPPLLRRAVLDR